MSTETTTGTGARPPPDSLLPGELRERIPALYASEDTDDPVVQAKLFTPWTTWTWFVTEFDGQETCFGLVSGHEVELGYFNLAELEAIEGPHGLRIERDLHFEPQPLSKVRQDLERMCEGPGGFTAHEDAEAFNPRANGSADVERDGRKPPSPIEQPGIRLIDTRLDTAGLAAEFGTVATPRAAALLLHHLIGEADCEHFAALFLNGKHRIAHAHIVSRGTAQTAPVHAREVSRRLCSPTRPRSSSGTTIPPETCNPRPTTRPSANRLRGLASCWASRCSTRSSSGTRAASTQQAPATSKPSPPRGRWPGKLDVDAGGDLAVICRALMHRGDIARPQTDPRLTDRLSLAFDDPTDGWRYLVLKDLVAALDALEKTRGDIEHRRRFALEIEDRTVQVSEAAERWQRCTDAVASDPRYKELERLPPQVGLLPLGRDRTSGRWEFWHVGSGSLPTWTGSFEEGSARLVDDGAGVVFVLLPGGRFSMGAQRQSRSTPGYDRGALPNEHPVIEVARAPFFMSKFEMTQSQWAGIFRERPKPSFYPAGSTPAGRIAVTGRNPVQGITWSEAKHVMRRFDLMLPTEAQWEYAARGGAPTPWWSGSGADSLVGCANIADGGARSIAEDGQPGHDDGHSVHAPVGSFRPNRFGLHDVIGNIWEWTSDRFSVYTAKPRQEDGVRAPFGSKVVYRRGSHQKPRLSMPSLRPLHAGTRGPHADDRSPSRPPPAPMMQRCWNAAAQGKDGPLIAARVARREPSVVTRVRTPTFAEH